MRISVDDGCQSDLRLSELCIKYDIELIIYLPVEWHSLAYENSYKPLDFESVKYLSRIHEIGSHTITHRHLTRIPKIEAEYEIATSKELLQKLLNVPINTFAPPRGYTNEELTKFTLEFYDEQRLTRGNHLVHIHPDSGANGNKPWRESIDENTTEIWGHSYDFDRYDMWDEIEEFMKEIA